MRRVLLTLLAALALAACGLNAAANVVVVTTAPAPRTRIGAPPATVPAFKLSAAKLTTDLAPTLLTLQHDNVAPQTVFADIAAQCGRGFDPSLGQYDTYVNWPLISIRADKEPFWQVVLALNDKIHAYPELRPDGIMRSHLYPGVIGQPFVSGAFLVRATTASRTAHFDRAPDLIDDCAVSLYVSAEPHIKIETMTRICVPDVAEDENGVSLVPTAVKPGDPEPLNENGGTYNAFAVRLSPPANAGRKIALLKGSLHVAVASKETTISVDDLTKPTTDAVELAELVISAVDARGTVRLRFRAPGIPPQEWPAFYNKLKTMRVTFFDKQGKAMPGTVGSTSSAPGSYESTWSPKRDDRGQKPGDPVRLTVAVPGAYQDVPVPFEFRDLPLP
jgi:hypothetical protein